MENKFVNEWNLWYHHEKNNWSIKGFRNIYKINNIESYWKLFNSWDKIGGVNNKHFFTILLFYSKLFNNSIDASPLHRASRALSSALNAHKSSFYVQRLFCSLDVGQVLLNDFQSLYYMPLYLSQLNQHPF